MRPERQPPLGLHPVAAGQHLRHRRPTGCRSGSAPRHAAEPLERRHMTFQERFLRLDSDNPVDGPARVRQPHVNSEDCDSIPGKLDRQVAEVDLGLGARLGAPAARTPPALSGFPPPRRSPPGGGPHTCAHRVRHPRAMLIDQPGQTRREVCRCFRGASRSSRSISSISRANGARRGASAPAPCDAAAPATRAPAAPSAGARDTDPPAPGPSSRPPWHRSRIAANSSTLDPIPAPSVITSQSVITIRPGPAQAVTTGPACRQLGPDHIRPLQRHRSVTHAEPLQAVMPGPVQAVTATLTLWLALG